MGRIVASVLFGVAEIQLSQIRERQAAGIALAKQRGVYKGRQKGTTKARPQRARDWSGKGLTQQEIATAMNISERTVRSYLKQCLEPPRIMKAELYLEVENNNKFVRGRKRAREDIEEFVLARYKARKRRKDGNEYILHIPYETDKDLDETVYGILSEAESHADMRHCFIEADARSLDDPDRYW